MGCQRKRPPHISLSSMLLSRRILLSSIHSFILISGCLQPTQPSWLQVLSNVAPPSLRRKAATDNMLQIIAAHSNWPVYICWYFWASTFTACISAPNTVRRDICRHNYTDWSTRQLLPTPLFDSQVAIPLVIHGLWWTVSVQVKAHVVLTCTNGVSPNHLSVIVASDRPWTTLSTRAHKQNLKADWIYSTKRMITQTQSNGWNLQRLQHSQNSNWKYYTKIAM